MLPRWRIEVPPGAAVIYAGTFRLKATTGYVLLVGRRIPPVARLAVRHSGPILLGLPPARASE